MPGTGAQSGTRIYVVDGSTGNPPSQVWRADGANLINAAALLATQAAHAGAASPNTGPGWALKSQLTSRPASGPYRPAFNPCTGQCWYDADVYSPKGFPDIVYLLGSYQYSELRERSNGRGVMISLTAGDPDPTTAAPVPIPTFNPGPPATIGPPFTADTTGGNFTDLTWDDTPAGQPDQTHPDQHAIITPLGQPFLFFEGSDGGLIRSDGTFDNASADCLKYHANDADTLVHCMRVLSRVPHQLYDTLNKGLSTLQFQSVSLNPKRPLHDLQGGTQDNGTFDWDFAADHLVRGDLRRRRPVRVQLLRRQDPLQHLLRLLHRRELPRRPVRQVAGHLRSLVAGEQRRGAVVLHSHRLGLHQLRPHHGVEVRRLPHRGGAALQHEPDHGGAERRRWPDWRVPRLPVRGPAARLADDPIRRSEDYLNTCPEFTTSGDDPRCGDWQPLADSGYTGPGHKTNNEPGDLTSAQYGADRLLGTVAAVERNPGNDNELSGGDQLRPRVRQLQRQQRGPEDGDLLPPGQRRGGDAAERRASAAVRLLHLSRSGESEPGLALVRRVHVEHEGLARPRLRGHLRRPDHLDLGLPDGSRLARPARGGRVADPFRSGGRHPHHRPRPRRLHRRPVRLDGLRRPARTAGGGRLRVGRGRGESAARRSARPDHRPLLARLYAATHGRSIWRMFLPPVSMPKGTPTECPRTP